MGDDPGREKMRDKETLGRVIPIHASAAVWLAVLSQVDLAARHPLNIGAAAIVAETFADQLREKLLAETVLSKEDYIASILEQLPFKKRPGPPGASR
jgi:hypothetical protein